MELDDLHLLPVDGVDALRPFVVDGGHLEAEQFLGRLVVSAADTFSRRVENVGVFEEAA